jgi:hypothetical protein
MAEASKSRITTGKVLASFVHVFVPTAIQEGQDKKYNMQLIFSKSSKEGKANLAKINAAVKAVEDEAIKKHWKGVKPKKWKTPVRDGDEEKEQEEYQDSWFLAVSSKNKPKVVDRRFEEIIDSEEFYSGCFCAVCINFYYFDVAGNKGIAAGLESVMKLSDGDRLGGSGGNVREDFAGFGDDEDDDELD